MYNLYGSEVGEEIPSLKNNVTIPLGKNTNFEVLVVAVLENGSRKSVGSATYIAGSTGSSSSDDDLVVEEGFDYVTSFKGTQDNGRSKLAWEAAFDCEE